MVRQIYMCITRYSKKKNIKCTKIRYSKIFNIVEVQSLRQKCREFEQQQEKAKKAHNEIESSMSSSINNLQSEVQSRKNKIAKVIDFVFTVLNITLLFNKYQMFISLFSPNYHIVI